MAVLGKNRIAVKKPDEEMFKLGLHLEPAVNRMKERMQKLLVGDGKLPGTGDGLLL